jgi:outer membrane protein assembly factor BamE (lipoprotein component of BamABCDE complex)
MNTRLPRRPALAALSASLATALLAVAGAASAASGFNVVANQEPLVKTGMTMDEVKQALGRPMRYSKYRNQPGPTYAYNVIGKDDYVFEVDFDATGKVVSSQERMEMKDGNGTPGS